MARQYWLVKCEPHECSFDELKKREKRTGFWRGVRNYQARNLMRDDMKVGDLVLFYHSNCKPPHVAGVAQVCKEGYPDFSAWDEESNYFDPKTNPDEPTWMMVDIEPVATLSAAVELPEMRANPALEGMALLQRFQRLSVQPVGENHFTEVCRMGRLEAATI